MSDQIGIKVEGIEELRRALNDVASKIRKQAVRGALRKAGAVITRAARQAAPVLQAPVRNRKMGTVKRNIVTRNSKFARQAGDEGVFIGVRPLRGSRQNKLGKAGAKNPNDPFYWRFLEFGTRKLRARPFLSSAADQKAGEAVQVFMREVVPQIEKFNQRAKRVR